MIKINLLNSVTDRQNGTAAVVDRKVSSPTSRLALMSVVAAVLLAAVIGWDVISTQMAKTAAQAELDAQKTRAAELEVVMNEQKELEAKINNIDARINSIKNLRASQAGPSAVLDALRERIAMTPGLFLESVEQSGETITIKGNSPDEAQVTQFGRSLEFSNGLFSNLNIETQRAEVTNQAAPQRANVSGGETPMVKLVNFTVKCAYTPSKAPNAPGATTAANQSPAPAQGAPAPPQVAKN